MSEENTKKTTKNTQETNIKKKKYKKPTLKTETLAQAYATSMGGGGGGGGGKVCNGATNGGRKATAGAGCTVLLT